MAKLAADENLTRRLGAAGAIRVKQYDWTHFVKRFDYYLDTLK